MTMNVAQFSAAGSLLLATAGMCQTQVHTPHTITLEIEGLSHDTVYLANYYGEKMFYADTAVTDGRGKAVFEGRPYEKCGKFAAVIPGPKFFEFLAVEEDIHIKTKAAQPSAFIEVIESEENRLFYDYLSFLQGKRTEAGPFEQILADTTAGTEDQEAARTALIDMGKLVEAEQRRIVAEHSDMLFAKYLSMVLDPEVPEFPQIANADEMRYRMYRDMYWKRVDFQDPRLVHDGSFNRILDTYLNQVIPQSPDTVLAEVIKLVERSRGNDEMFKYILHFATFNAESSPIMCMDKVFVELVNRYYKAGDATWLNADQLAKITDRAGELEPTVCGKRVPDIILPGLDQTTWHRLYDLDSKCTCGHCKKELPKIQALYEEWKDRGLSIFAIGNDFEPEPWQTFVEKQDLDEWVHVSDNPAINNQDSATVLIARGITTLQSLNFRTTFDVFATPKLFLLDRDKAVIAKQIGAEQLGEILTKLEEMEGNGTLQPMRKDEDQ
jgi:thiol-disulfide isomerase/thioredoxin